MNLYTYKAKVLRVVDGDTIELSIDLGFTITWTSTCRLSGINAYELRAEDEKLRAKAQRGKEWMEKQLPAGTEVTIVSKALDKYGRPVAEVWKGKMNINNAMLDEGLAVKYKS
jgi:micrococcal nuclease